MVVLFFALHFPFRMECRQKQELLQGGLPLQLCWLSLSQLLARSQGLDDCCLYFCFSEKEMNIEISNDMDPSDDDKEEYWFLSPCVVWALKLGFLLSVMQVPDSRFDCWGKEGPTWKTAVRINTLPATGYTKGQVIWPHWAAFVLEMLVVFDTWQFGLGPLLCPFFML